MASQTEVGHAKNLANLKLLKDIITQVGVAYNPSNALLSVASVTNLIAQCQTDYDNWANKLIDFKYQTDQREIAFEPITKLATSSNKSVQQLNEPQQTFNDVQFYVSKIHGAEKKIKSKAAVRLADPNANPPATDPAPLPPDPISTSQLSYDSILKNLDLLIQRLQVISTYAPNETELQLATLQTQFANLTALNTAAGSATNALSLARNQRNLSYYAPQTGLYDITIKIKNYLRSNSATANSAYKDATKLKFVKIVQRKKKQKTSA
jgi:hypothetical protein